MFGIAAVVLFILAAIFQFAGFHQVSALGLSFCGLACLAIHLLGAWPVRYPWTRAP